MKNVYTSWDINLLADKMIEKITECWKSPFNSPAVIFTDPKTEQWFKLRWLRNPAVGKGILMNLKTLRIQQFLFDLITPKTSDFQNVQRLSVELLRDVIISKLTSKTGGNYYFESLDNSDVTNYLTNKTARGFEINPVHLYDFAQKLASLFMEYEDTRPDSLDALLEKEAWQKKLYYDVITERGLVIDGCNYMTLSELRNLNKKINKTELPVFNWNKDCPVFIFGFSGLGDIYRSLLSDFAKENQLEVFLQTSASSDDSSSNQLVQKLAAFGKYHFSLWNKEASLQSLSSADSFSKTDSLLHRIQKSVSEDTRIIPEAFNENDTSLTLTSAPTKVREVEVLHSKICKLLSQPDNSVQLGDILVVAPHIQDYCTAIEEVFDQNDKNDLSEAAGVFPYIPYIIADYSGERSLTAEALNILFKIIKRGYLARSDFFALLRNYLVQTARGISDDEVSTWTDWVSELYTFRNRQNKADWDKAKKRLLLAKLTDEPLSGSDEDYLPFENLDTENNDSLYNFIQAVDELQEWESFSSDNSDKSTLTITDIERIRELLEKWLLLSNDIPALLYNETLVFQNIIEEIDRQIKTARDSLSAGNSGIIYSDCFFAALLDRSHQVSLHNSNLFSQGITFANFESNRILSAKYVFFMGLDSKIFPGLDSEDDLDLRTYEKEAEDLKNQIEESIPYKNKNAFLCQLMAAEEGFFISYINKDLQKDEDFYKSSVLQDLFSAVYDKETNNTKPLPYERQIKIDESRDWDQLYTKREFRNKNNYIYFQNGRKIEADNSQTVQDFVSVLPDRVTISNIKQFLTDPFQFMAKQKFGNSLDNSEEETLEYEPLSLDNIEASALRKAFVKEALKNQTIDFDESSLRKDLKNRNILPDSFFGDAAISKIFTETQAVLEAFPESIDTTKLTFDSNALLSIKQEYEIDGEIKFKEWQLSGELSCYNKDFAETEDHILYTFDFNNQENFLSGYLTSVICIASLPEEDETEYSIELSVIGNKNGGKLTSCEIFTLTGQEARNLLIAIYQKMYISPFYKCLPFDLIETTIYIDSLTGEIKTAEDWTFEDFIGSLFNEYTGKWKYFNKSSLFNAGKVLSCEPFGYAENKDIFQEKWKEACLQELQLLKFIKLKTIENQNEGE